MTGVFRSISYKKYLLLFPAAWFMALGAMNFIFTLIGHHFNWIDLIVFICFSIPLFIKKPGIYQTFGLIYFMLWVFLLIALTSDLVKYLDSNKHSARAATYFGFGYAFIGFCIVCACLLMYIGTIKLKPGIR